MRGCTMHPNRTCYNYCMCIYMCIYIYTSMCIYIYMCVYIYMHYLYVYIYNYISWFHCLGQKHRTHKITQCHSCMETMEIIQKKSCCSLSPPKKQDTPPKFNIAPEKWWLEDYFPIGKVTVPGLCETSGG